MTCTSPKSAPAVEKKRKRKRTHQILELPARLLDDAVLAAEDDAHARQVADLGAADDERVDVKSATGENSGDAR